MLINQSYSIGEYIGRFRVLDLIGQGAMASVYRALDTENHRIVVLKIPDPGLARKTDFAAHLSKEARAMALLEHPGIVRMYSLEESDGLVFLVMEYVEGVPLSQILKEKGRPDMRETIGYLLQICDAIGYAHGRRVIHRDLKPGNILVGPRGRVRIADFGISKTISSDNTDGTITFVGTPLYMSPEQCGEGVLDARTDIYSLGVIFYEMLVGNPPFAGNSPAEIIKGHLFDSPKFPSDAQPAIPARILKIIRKMLAKNPGNRYSSAREVIAELEAFQETLLRAGPKRKPSRRTPLILCYAPQRLLMGAVAAALKTIACRVELMSRISDLMNRVQSQAVEAVVLGSEPGSTSVFRLARRVRKKNKNPRLRVFLISAGVGREEVQEAFRSGVTDIIAEPFNPSVLISKLEGILPDDQKTLESRRFFRTRFLGKATMRVASEIVDISEGGMRILTNMPLKAGEITAFDLDLFRTLGLGEKSGKVVWISGNDLNDSYFYQAGIDFTDMSDSERERLRKWILENELINRPAP